MMYPVSLDTPAPKEKPEEEQASNLEENPQKANDTPPKEEGTQAADNNGDESSTLDESKDTSYCSQTPTAGEDDSFTTAATPTVDAQARAWYYLPEPMQRLLTTFTTEERQLLCVIASIAMLIIMVSSVSGALATAGHPSSIEPSSTMQVTSSNNGTATTTSTGSTTGPAPASPIPTEIPTTKGPVGTNEPTRWYSDMTTGPTTDIESYIAGTPAPSYSYSRRPSIAGYRTRAPTTISPTNYGSTETPTTPLSTGTLTPSMMSKPEPTPYHHHHLPSLVHPLTTHRPTLSSYFPTISPNTPPPTATTKAPSDSVVLVSDNHQYTREPTAVPVSAAAPVKKFTTPPTRDVTPHPSKRPTTVAPTYMPTQSPSVAPQQSFPEHATTPPHPSSMKFGTAAPRPTSVGTDAPQPAYSSVGTAAPRPPSSFQGNITYVPGVLSKEVNGLKLSRGLNARLIAKAGDFVSYATGHNSSVPFHSRPDAGATFADTRSWNPNGWVYVSNSEMRLDDGGPRQGGVGAITFDAQGKILHYERILSNSTWNCGGGRTPWNTWISCEEAPGGLIWQVDPFGIREPEVLTLGRDGGRFESFAYDARNASRPRFFVTEDHERGALQRFTPNNPDWTNDPWSMLHGNGTTEYLVLKPNNRMTGGKFRWTSNRELAENRVRRLYPNTEGIAAHGNRLYFVSKVFKQLYELNLDEMTYTNSTTRQGLFDGTPDQIQRIMHAGSKQTRDAPDPEEEILYLTEEDGRHAGVHGRNANGDYFTIVESPVYEDEVTGLAFSPDGMHMYFSYQVPGLLFDVYREDGRPFNAKALDVQYHGGPAIQIDEDGNSID
ncbi:osmC-like protein [Seminavis robusta]|uniref:OsmC-like protein n=1 Tax=Seminavis robusta TaxID=568900 RepID=A0A9N8DMT4_9STRA|nr:osmC-like protein [Seminavis robusta]|eukprot:Sro213_g088590.1 osmC-like protein (831) ;mRNA; f:79597-82272